MKYSRGALESPILRCFPGKLVLRYFTKFPGASSNTIGEFCKAALRSVSLGSSF